MSGGLFALLDDVAALVRLAAASLDDVAAAAGKASAKAAGVVIDDTAVTPQYLQGIDPKRELPIIKKITIGSLRNKLIFILPLALLLSQFASWLLTPLLMLGGSYLCYEGAHKVWEKLTGHKPEAKKPVMDQGSDAAAAEAQVVRNATTTDFILSAEIMVIALNEVAKEPLLNRAIILVLVALGITALVYGVVAIIVKLDDVGLYLAGKDRASTRKFGEGMVKAMPVVLNVITVVGTLAMLWVGGHIILQGCYDLGWKAPMNLVHAAEAPFQSIAVVGGLLAWLVNTALSLIVGLAWGFAILGVISLLPFGKGDKEHAETAGAPPATATDAPSSTENP